MPPSKKLQGSHRELITNLIQKQGMTLVGVLEYLGTELEVHVSRSTLKRRLKEWDLRINNSWKAIDTPGLRLRIAGLWYESCLSESELLHALQAEGMYDQRSFSFTYKRLSCDCCAGTAGKDVGCGTPMLW